MIRAVLVMNTQGKPRLVKFYDYLPLEKQQELIRSIYGALSSRPENVSNFIEADAIFGLDTRLVYKHFATLYFVFLFDSCENDLAMLDLIQVFVETLDKCFKNVCELDVVFNFNKLHTILDEIVVGGQVLETNSTEVMKAVDEIAKFSLRLSQMFMSPKEIIFTIHCFAHVGWRDLQIQSCLFQRLFLADRADIAPVQIRMHCLITHARVFVLLLLMRSFVWLRRAELYLLLLAEKSSS